MDKNVITRILNERLKLNRQRNVNGLAHEDVLYEIRNIAHDFAREFSVMDESFNYGEFIRKVESI